MAIGDIVRGLSTAPLLLTVATEGSQYSAYPFMLCLLSGSLIREGGGA